MKSHSYGKWLCRWARSSWCFSLYWQTLKVSKEALRLFETSGAVRQTTHLHMPEHPNRQFHRLHVIKLNPTACQLAHGCDKKNASKPCHVMEINSRILTFILTESCGTGGGHFTHSLRTRKGSNAHENIRKFRYTAVPIYKLKKLRKKENVHLQTAHLKRGIWDLLYCQHLFVKDSSLLMPFGLVCEWPWLRYN